MFVSWIETWPDMPKRDFYEVLGVSKDADEKAIKSAYRKLAMANHPDRNAGDEAAAERFKEASEAYEVLKDSDMVVLDTENDTILVNFLVSKTGKITLSSLDASQLSEASIQNLNEILSASLLELPKLYPAIKRSQHVQTVFQLPIILNTN